MLNPVLIITHQTLEFKLLGIPHPSIEMPVRDRGAVRQVGVLGRSGGEGPGVGSVEIEEHDDEEVEQEGDAVEDEDVRHVGDVGFGQQGHLFFRRAHEEEARSTKELLVFTVESAMTTKI